MYEGRLLPSVRRSKKLVRAHRASKLTTEALMNGGCNSDSYRRAVVKRVCMLERRSEPVDTSAVIIRERPDQQEKSGMGRRSEVRRREPNHRHRSCVPVA